MALRVREPDLGRPCRVPGCFFGAVAIGIGPLALIVASVIRNRTEQVGSVSALTIGLLFIAAGPVLYFLARAFRPQRINP